jgi:NAD(P)-dependent dehydrogenase (short-subunit alcohol dehydrogenase family)
MPSFANRRLIVTGAGSGIGKEVAKRAMSAGARVASLDLDGAAAKETVAGHEGSVGISVDVTQVDSVAAAFRSVSALLGPVDGLVTCAGVTSQGSLSDIDPVRFDRTISVNLRGTYLTVRAFVEQMEGPGVITTVASTAAFGHVAGLGIDYHASKAAISGMTAYLAVELGPRGIRANGVAPGLVRTPMTEDMLDRVGEALPAQGVPLGRLATKGDVAAVILFLQSEDAAMVSGRILPVDGAVLAVASAGWGGTHERSSDPVS